MNPQLLSRHVAVLVPEGGMAQTVRRIRAVLDRLSAGALTEETLQQVVDAVAPPPPRAPTGSLPLTAAGGPRGPSATLPLPVASAPRAPTGSLPPAAGSRAHAGTLPLPLMSARPPRTPAGELPLSAAGSPRVPTGGSPLLAAAAPRPLGVSMTSRAVGGVAATMRLPTFGPAAGQSEPVSRTVPTLQNLAKLDPIADVLESAHAAALPGPTSGVVPAVQPAEPEPEPEVSVVFSEPPPAPPAPRPPSRTKTQQGSTLLPLSTFMSAAPAPSVSPTPWLRPARVSRAAPVARAAATGTEPEIVFELPPSEPEAPEVVISLPPAAPARRRPPLMAASALLVVLACAAATFHFLHSPTRHGAAVAAAGTLQLAIAPPEALRDAPAPSKPKVAAKRRPKPAPVEEAGADGRAERERVRRSPQLARAQALVDEGVALAKKDRLGLAEAAYLKSLKVWPSYPRAMAALVRMHLQRRDGAEAERWAKQLVALQPKNGANQLLLGDAHALRGDAKSARAAWSLAARSGNAVARERLRR